jgi:hypothetical protein
MLISQRYGIPCGCCYGKQDTSLQRSTLNAFVNKYDSAAC